MKLRSRFGGTGDPRVKLLRIPSVMVAGMLVVAACGGGDDDDDSTSGGDSDLPPELAEAAAKAEELGLRFASREEIEAGAEKEDHLNVIWALAPDDFLDQAVMAFTEDHPNLEGNVTVSALDGFDGRQRFLLEAQSGAANDYGMLYLANEVYTDMQEYCDWDIYGMAEAGVLDIPLDMIDPNNRMVLSAGNSSSAFVYNIEAFESQNIPLPETWDDIVDHPEIYGPDGKIDIVGDVRLATFAALVPSWGLEKAKDWYKRFAEDIQPVWSARFGPTIQQIQAGEFDAMPFVNVHNAFDLMEGRPDTMSYPLTEGSKIGIKYIEPVPVRTTDTHCVAYDDMNPTPYSSLLFLEWLASDEGQLAYENPDGAPYQGSIYTELEGGLADLLEPAGELSIVTWEDLPQIDGWAEEIIAAAGFPEASGG